MDSLEKRRNTYEKLNYYDLITLCIKRKDKIDELKKENERLLKTQEMYEKKYNNIHNYILQNCEIIRHKDYDEVGKVNGGHILFLLNGGDDNE